MSDPQNVMIVPLPKQEAPVAPAPAPQEPTVSQSVPYDRFRQVNEEKKAYAERAAKLEQVLAQVNTSLNPSVEQIPQFETAEQLTRYIEERTDKKLEAKLNEAYQKYIAPREQHEMLSAYGNGVERYFASDPQATQIRAEMDAQTAVLPEWKKQAIIQGVMNGDYEMLDIIKQRVLQSKAQNVQGQVTSHLQAQVPMAQAPQPFRATVNVAPTKEELIANARKSGDWKNVFDLLGPIPEKK